MKKTLLLILLVSSIFSLNAVKKVAYVTLNKTTMDASATTVQNDPIIQVLKADPNLEVTVKVVLATDVITDLADYDVIVIQESIGGGDAILKPAGSLAIASLTKPFVYNKSYALKSTRALTTSSAAGGKEATACLTITVQPAALTNDLFKACTISASNEIILFNALMTDLGVPTGTTTTLKALNYSTGNVVSGSSTILATPTTLNTDASPVAISFNDLPSGTAIDSETTKARSIFMGMNFGAISGNGGKNITDNGLTIWRNAIYILAGLPVPTTKATLPTAISNLENTSRVISEEYFTMNGVQIKYPTRGVFVKRTNFENGTSNVDKVVYIDPLMK